MGRTFLRQDAQIRKSVTYTDSFAPGSVQMELNPVHIEDDLNNLRSQIKRVLDHTGGKWYDDVSTVQTIGSAKKRSLKSLNTDLDGLEESRFLFRVHLVTTVAVPASQNYVVLSQSGGETPSIAAAVGTTTANGAVTAELSADVGSHSLTDVTGPNALSPKNLCLIVDGSGDPIESSGRPVYGLFQAEDGTADGDSFNDTNKQAQLSFVRPNAGNTDLEACPVADIESTNITYAYVRRLALSTLPEEAFLSGTFTDAAGGAVDVTLDNAIDNQVGAATQTDRNIDWRITDTYTMKFQTSDGGVDLLAITPTASGDTVQFNADDFDVNTVNEPDFNTGIKVDTDGNPIDIGVTPGHVETGVGDDLHIQAGQEMYFDDVNQSGSTWAQTDGVKLSENTTEWDDFKTEFGEVSVFSALVQASQSGGHKKAYAVVTTLIPADTNVTGAGGSPNLDATLLDYSSLTFIDDVNVYLNGDLMRSGANAAANHDVYPGDTPSNGDLKFEFNLRGAPGNPDVVCMETFGG